MKRDSIFFRLTSAFIWFGLVPLLLAGMLLYTTFERNIEEVTLKDFSHLLNYAGENIAISLDECGNLVQDIYYQDTDDGRMLWDFLKDPDVDVQQRSLQMNMVMQNILDEDSKIRSAYFIDKQGNISYATKNTQKVLTENKWLSVMEGAHKFSREIRVAESHIDDYFKGSENQVLTFICDFKDVSTYDTIHQTLGTLYLDLDFSVIFGMTSDISLNEEGIFRIMDRQRMCIYSYKEKEIGRKLTKIPNPEFADEETEKSIKSKGNYYVYYKIPDTNWTVEVEVSQAAVLRNVQMVRSFVFFVLLLSLAILFLIYRYFLKGIRRPMNELIDGMNQIQNGNLQTRVKVEQNDEIGNLAKGLNQMAEELDEYIQRVYVSELRQRETELDMLKTQIKPHYLYNTLEVIRMQAVSNDDFETAEMVESLSGQLRYLIGKKGDYVTLQDEISNIEEYFKLLRIRYEGRFFLKVEVPEELRNLHIIKLSLQPIVENAIKHGLIPKPGEGTIQISARADDSYLEITVMDDGVGMSKEVLEELRRKIEKNEEDREEKIHLGIRNTAERLQKSFGDSCGLEVFSEKNFGTIVTMRYPVSF